MKKQINALLSENELQRLVTICNEFGCPTVGLLVNYDIVMDVEHFNLTNRKNKFNYKCK